MGRLDGKVAVITGGSSGIGRASARLFVEEGARVVVADIQDERGRELAKELGPDAVFAHADVAREEDLEAAVRLAAERFGRLDCMFNNAGIAGAGGPLELIPAFAFDMTVAVLFRSVFLGMKHAAAAMKPQGSGSILSTASIAGLRTGFGGHVYSACKAAVVHLTRTAAVELGPFGIRVNCICPGAIATPIFGRGVGLDQEAAEATDAGVREMFRETQAVRRAGLPEDIARAAAFLASDDAGFVSGAALVVDGAFPDGLFATEEGIQRMLGALGVEAPGF